jgi:hypothetical protein
MGSGAERRYQKGEPTSIRSSDARSRQLLAVIPQKLAKLKDLAELSPDRLLALTNRISVHRFAKRSLIYREGQLGDGLYIMLSGIAKLTCLNRKGERVLLECSDPVTWSAFPRCCRTCVTSFAAKHSRIADSDCSASKSWLRGLSVCPLATSVWRSGLPWVVGGTSSCVTPIRWTKISTTEFVSHCSTWAPNSARKTSAGRF